MEEFKPNSFKYRQEQASSNDDKKEKVTTNKVVTKKQPVTRKVAGDFLNGDAHRVKDYLIYDVAIPAFKKLISEGISSAVDMMLYGETRRHERISDGNGVRRSGTSYSSYYNNGGSQPRVATRAGYEYEEVLFESRGDAEKVLDSMWNDIKQFREVSVASMYDYAGVTSTRYTDNNYGWTEENFGTADVGRYSDGYHYLKLSKPVALRH